MEFIAFYFSHITYGELLHSFIYIWMLAIECFDT